MKLLSREEFKKAVFERDNHSCIVCGKPAIDAHHLLERKLWVDGGYYLDNGVSLCSYDHLLAEQTCIEIERLRLLAGITNVIVPEGFNPELIYDKWGNCKSDRCYVKGPLFNDAGCQKMLKEAGLLYSRIWV